MNNNSDTNRQDLLFKAIQELVDKGEVSENVLHNSDTFMEWWRSLNLVKQMEIMDRVGEISRVNNSKIIENRVSPGKEPDNSENEREEINSNKESEIVYSGGNQSQSQNHQTGTTFSLRSQKTPLVLLCLALAAAIIYGGIVTGDKNDLITELAFTQNELASTQLELNSTQQTLALSQTNLDSTKNELNSTKRTLVSTQATLDTTKTELATTKQNLTSTNRELGSTKQTLSSTKSELTTTQQDLALAQETLEGLGITLSSSKECYDVDLIDNLTATNPSWSQLISFLSQDFTDRNVYILGVYDCSQFSQSIHNNAEAAGIRTAEVHIDFENEITGHALNAFLTTDYGLVYVDCTERDTIARVKVEKEYRAIETYSIMGTMVRNDYWWDSLQSYYYIPTSLSSWSTQGAVTSGIRIFW
jgi:hypothetical protein